MPTLPLSPRSQNLPRTQSLNIPATTSTPANGTENHAASVEPARVRRAKKSKAADDLYHKTDAEVWTTEDKAIIEAAEARWSSKAYKHMQISLDPPYTVRLRTPIPTTITFVFKCDRGNKSHPDFRRARMDTSVGTGNLVAAVRACEASLGLPSSLTGNTSSTTVPFSPELFRAGWVMECAKSHRPFEMSGDEWLKRLFKLANPAVQLPHPTTISRDAKHFYLVLSDRVKDYFAKRDLPIHAFEDGWTAPTRESWLGLGIQWYANGDVYRAILEFIKLTEAHTGKYLAERTHECFQRFGLIDYFFSMCMDNASNCDTTARSLHDLIPSFDADAYRLRCFCHILNLIAKMFISFFFKPYKRKAVPKVARGTKRKRSALPPAPPAAPARSALPPAPAPARSTRRRTTVPQPPPPELESESDDEEPMEEIREHEVVLDEPDLSDDEREVAQTAIEIDNEAPVDNGQEEHDQAVLRSTRDLAVAQMAQRPVPVEISAQENKDALGIFPKTSGLARRVHDSAPLKVKLKDLISADKDLHTDVSTLTLRVPTRWNGDLANIDRHLLLKAPVQALTGQTQHKLGAYALNTRQWALAEEAADVLAIFKPLTDIFSRKQVPLVPDVIPKMEDIEAALVAVRESETSSPVIRVAAHASLLLHAKYHTLFGKSYAYAVAFVMCPDKKLAGLRQLGWSDARIRKLEEQILDIWDAKYKHKAKITLATPAGSAAASSQRVSPWLKASSTRTEAREPDDIRTYLADAPIPTQALEMLATSGNGVMKYWHKQWDKTPALAQMGSDFCSMPATSVDVERAFSEGRREIGFMQHNMSAQTFRAEMALGSWDGQPFFPDWQDLGQFLKKDGDS